MNLCERCFVSNALSSFIYTIGYRNLTLSYIKFANEDIAYLKVQAYNCDIKALYTGTVQL